jgi:hypothetical protein
VPVFGASSLAERSADVPRNVFHNVLVEVVQELVVVVGQEPTSRSAWSLVEARIQRAAPPALALPR